MGEDRLGSKASLLRSNIVVPTIKKNCRKHGEVEFVELWSSGAQIVVGNKRNGGITSEQLPMYESDTAADEHGWGEARRFYAGAVGLRASRLKNCAQRYVIPVCDVGN